MFDQAGPLYARILAFNRTGKGLLHEIKKNSALPLVSKTSHFLKDAALKRLPKERTLLENMLALDIRATELRRLCLPALSAHGEDLRQHEQRFNHPPAIPFDDVENLCQIL